MEPLGDFISKNGVAGVGVVLLALIIGMILKYTPRLIESHLDNVRTLTQQGKETNKNLEVIATKGELTASVLAQLNGAALPQLQGLSEDNLKTHRVLKIYSDIVKEMAEHNLTGDAKARVLAAIELVRRNLERS